MVDTDRTARNIEAVCGKPQMISHPLYRELTSRLIPLTDRVAESLARGGAPFLHFGDLKKPSDQREFIRAAAHYFPTETFQLSNLVTTRPPDNIHRMQRSDPYWVGDFFSGNMIVHALEKCHLLKDGMSILDIGCSSGSLVRVLAAYDRSWILHGCDPIRSAIDWARLNVVTARFDHMGTRPPLTYSDSSLDGVTAISVWSHHRPDAAKAWIDEVHRILKPGGWFAVTFSTLHHVAWMAAKQKAPALLLRQMLEDMAKTGNHFVPVKYKEEDSDTDVDWGQSCYSREAFFEMFCDSFDVAGYFPGLNQGNQDLAVFLKVS